MISYNDKEKSYFSNVRTDLIKLLPKESTLYIIALVAGAVDTLVAIKGKGLASEVVGVELNELPHSNQKNQLIDRFIFANIEKDQLDLPENYFDVIVYGDILEHLVDPWKSIDETIKYLRHGGYFIVSLPNIRHIRAAYQIFLKGSFAYQAHGIFDKTHMRFFCKKDMLDLLEGHNRSIHKIIPNFALQENVPKKLKIINTLTFRMFEGFLATQFLFVGRKFK